MSDRTVDSIINWFTEAVGSKQPISPRLWCEAGADLNVLRSDEDDKVYDLQQKVAQRKVEFIEMGDSVAMAKAKVEASEDYKNLCKQKAKCERITEFIRLVKVMSKLKSDELSGY